MSSFGAQHSLIDCEERSCDASRDLPFFMQGDEASVERQPRRLTTTALIQLIQCSICSKPFSAPITLPCGYTVCRTCLPEPRLRSNISYPNTPDRQYGILCPHRGCAQEHVVGECNIDVLLSKLITSIRYEFQQRRLEQENSGALLGNTSTLEDLEMLLKLSPRQESGHHLTPEINPEEPALGKLVETFLSAENGDLEYAPVLLRQSPRPNISNDHDVTAEIVEFLRVITRRELDCHICYNLLLDPVTTTCGHTFCRKCLCRAFDHSRHCPICRRELQMPPSLDRQSSNKQLTELLSTLCPDDVAARAEMITKDEQPLDETTMVPLFICTAGFPEMPTFLHIFEPRYRLMIRRAMEGNRRFGLIMYNRRGLPQGDMGVTPFLEYGTMMEIMHMQMLPGGRSYIELKGVSRFRVRAFGMLDGYTTGNIEFVNDISLADEERIEAQEITASLAGIVNQRFETGSNATVESERFLSHLSTQQLLLKAMEFLNRARSTNPAWLSRDILISFGNPPTDPAIFPYWFASVLPIDANESYPLLYTTSVRERLKTINRWITRIESQRW